MPENMDPEQAAVVCRQRDLIAYGQDVGGPNRYYGRLANLWSSLKQAAADGTRRVWISYHQSAHAWPATVADVTENGTIRLADGREIPMTLKALGLPGSVA